MNKFMVFFLIYVFALIGCTTAIWGEDYPVVESSSKFRLSEKDEIYAFAKTNESDPNFLILGHRYTYQITKGKPIMLALADSKLNRSNLSLASDTIQFELQDNNTFSAMIVLRYIDDNMTENKLALLKKSGFRNFRNPTLDHDDYRLHVTITGSIFQAIDQPELKNRAQHLKKRYQVLLGKYIDKTKINPLLFVGKIIATPFTLMSDAVIVPIYLLSDPKMTW